MRILVVDCKKNEMIKVKIELNEHIFLVVPEIINHRFDYMRYRLMEMRKKYINVYLDNKLNYKEIEYQIYDEMREMLITEMENIHRTEGIMYYTI